MDKVEFDNKIYKEVIHPVTHLTDNYKTDIDSNNYKILDLGHTEHLQILNNLRLIEAWRDLDFAEGFTLDKIGKNVLEPRENRVDTDYRKAIRLKIRGNLSAGTVEDLNDIGAILFENSFKGVSETFSLELYNFEPAAVALNLHNLTVVRGSNTLNELDFFNEIMAGGVGLYAHQTFDFDVNTVEACGLHLCLSEYIVVESEPIQTDITDYTSVAHTVFEKPYIITDSVEIPRSIETLSTVSPLFTQSQYHAEIFETNNNPKSISTTAPYLLIKEVKEIE